ncbi:MAG: DUF4421 family protein [Prevotellaceae bacterium]|nr:DUF4421 family protein [Prevotellaceae bacterium]
MTIKPKLIYKLFIAVLLTQSITANAGSPVKTLKKVGALLDTLSVKGVDRNYIDAPKEPWQIIVKGNINQSDLKMRATGDIDIVSYKAEPRLKTEPSKYIGLWAGYRGYGLGYTINTGGDKGSYFTVGATGGSYGVNVRVHSFENNRPSFSFSTDFDDLINEDIDLEEEEVELEDPIRVHTVIADAYYLFNGKRFSYAAAYDQSVIQKKSAGSIMAGAMFYYGKIDYATKNNAELIYLMRGLGKVKLWQGSVGAGYAYNWVPVKGLLVNAMAMPMLTLVNRIKVYAFKTNVEDVMNQYEDDEYPSDEELLAQYVITPLTRKSYNSGIAVNFDARISVTYNFGRYFVNAYGQFNNFRYTHEDNRGRLNDWFVNAAFGVRL